MTLQFLLNLIIALVWMFLHDDAEWSTARFAVGYLIGIGCIGLLRRFFPHEFYLKRLWAMVKLLVLFGRELFLSGFAVLRQIVRPTLSIRPGVFTMRTELRTDWEITLLSCLICLTPGTLTLDVSREERMLCIHAMDIADADELAGQIKRTFERAILEVTRPC